MTNTRGKKHSSLLIAFIIVVMVSIGAGFTYLATARSELTYSTSTISGSVTMRSVESYGPTITLAQAQQFVNANFSIPTDLPNGLQLQSIRGSPNLVALIFSSPTLGTLQSWDAGSAIMVIARDNTSYVSPDTQVSTVEQYCTTATEPPITTSCTISTLNAPTSKANSTIANVTVSGNPGWGYDSQGTSPGFLNWWGSGVHYGIIADLPLATLVGIGQSMGTGGM